MKPHLQYAWYLARHKWFVFLAGLKTGVALWRIVVHDWSKFSKAEWNGYAKYDWVSEPNDLALDLAWLHHQHRNPHHWQHWVLREDDGGTKILRMPEHFVREMVADWAGAGRAITGQWEVLGWYEKSKEKIQLHPETRMYVEYLLGKLEN